MTQFRIMRNHSFTPKEYGINRCRCDEHFKNLIEHLPILEYIRQSSFINDLWVRPTWKDKLFYKNKLVCEVCSGKFKDLNMTGLVK